MQGLGTNVESLRDIPQVQALRAMVQADPSKLQPILDEFIRLMNEPAAEGGRRRSISEQLAKFIPQTGVETPEVIERLGNFPENKRETNNKSYIVYIIHGMFFRVRVDSVISGESIDQRWVRCDHSSVHHICTTSPKLGPRLFIFLGMYCKELIRYDISHPTVHESLYKCNSMPVATLDLLSVFLCAFLE